MFDDIVQLRACVSRIQTSLASLGSDEGIETTTYEMARAVALIKVLDAEDKVIRESDRTMFESLRRQLSNSLKDKMLQAISVK